MPDDFRGALRNLTPLHCWQDFTRVILNRLVAVAEQNLPEVQCVFRPGRSTVDMICAMRQLQEKCIE